MDYRAHGGVWIGPATFTVEDYPDGCAVVSTRWYRYADGKDFDVEVIKAGLTREAASQLIADLTLKGSRKANLPAVGEATRALLNGAGHTAQQKRAAGRVWINHFGVRSPDDCMYPVYQLAARAVA